MGRPGTGLAAMFSLVAYLYKGYVQKLNWIWEYAEGSTKHGAIRNAAHASDGNIEGEGFGGCTTQDNHNKDLMLIRGGHNPTLPSSWSSGHKWADEAGSYLLDKNYHAWIP